MTTSTADTGKRLSDEDAELVKRLRATSIGTASHLCHKAADAIERLTAPPSLGKVERAREILEHNMTFCSAPPLDTTQELFVLAAISQALTEPAQGTSVEGMREAAAKCIADHAFSPPRGPDEFLQTELAEVWADEIRALPLSVSADGSAEKLLGFVNVYRDKDGSIDLGSTDLFATLEEVHPYAADFCEHVGTARVMLLQSTKHEGGGK
jgi:hypothetical protein